MTRILMFEKTHKKSQMTGVTCVLYFLLKVITK